WYPLFSVMMAVIYLMPLIALARNEVLVNVTYPEFLARSGIGSGILVLMVFWWRRNGFWRPRDAKVFSWTGALFLFARWPWSLYGVFAGLANWVRGREVEFRVTPKGPVATGSLPSRVIIPYAVLSLISSTVVLVADAANAPGFYVFASINALIYAAV